jgi:FAD synthase
MNIRPGLSDPAVHGPAVAIIGTWDPLLHVHRELFQRLAARGSEAGLTPVVIVLHPAPVRLLNPDPAICLEYTDIRARLALIRECAAVRVLTVNMTVPDLDATVQRFFDVVCSHVELRELWLGADQTLGRCDQSSDEALAAVMCSRNISLRRLSASPESHAGGTALRLLGKGRLKDAVECAGHAPIWGRVSSGTLKLNWPPGKYVAVPLVKPSLVPVVMTAPVSVEVVWTYEGGTLEWPEPTALWLSFLAGPADCPNTGES